MRYNFLTSKQAGYYYLDLMKAFFSICVIAIHAKVGGIISNEYGLALYNLIVSCAVPFFFASSGFLIAEKIDGEVQETEQRYLQDTLVKYIRMYAKWNIIYLPITIWGFFRDGLSGTSFVKIMLIWIRGILLVGEQFCSWPLWYLLSMILGIMIVKKVIRKVDKKSHTVAGLAGLFFSLAWILNVVREYQDSIGVLKLLQKVIIYTLGSGRIFTGVSFVLLGIWTYYHLDVMPKNFYIVMLDILICGGYCMLMKLEYSTTYPLTLLIIPLLIKITCNKKLVQCRYGVTMRQFSQDAYFTHMFFVFLLTYNIVNFKKLNTFPITVFVLSLTGVALIGIIRRSMSRLKQRRHEK